MARIDYTGVPTAEAQVQAPDDLQHIEASPDAFGAGVGQAVSNAGEDLKSLSHFYGQVAADGATNNFLDGSQKLLYGDLSQPAVDEGGAPIKGPDGSPVGTGGFYSLRGADALNAAPKVQQQLDALIKQQRESLTTPESQQQFETESRRYRAQALERMSSFTDQQYKNWGIATNDNGITITQNGIATHLNDPTALAADQQALRKFYVRKETLQFGGSPEVANGAILKADQDFALTQIRSAIGNNDPMRAQKALDDHRDVLGSLPNFDSVARTVKGAVIDATMAPAIDHAVNDAMTSATHSVSAAPSQDYSQVPFAQVKANIIGHETSPAVGGYNAVVYNTANGGNAIGVKAPQPLTSMTLGQVHDFQVNTLHPASVGHRGASDPGSSAVGAYQFESGTLEAQAKAVFGDKWRDQPFSAQTQDKLAEHLFDQVKGNPRALSNTWAAFGGAAAGQHYPSVADALNANMTTTLDKAQIDGEKLFRNYPDAQDRYVQGVRRHLEQVVSQQHQQYEVDSHVIQGVMAGDNPPISEQQLLSMGPEVAQRWRSMKINNPSAAMSVERMFDANAKGRAEGLGSNFQDYIDRVLAPSNDPNRITNPTQLWGSVGSGANAPLTNSGVNHLATLLQGRGTPAGEAAAAQIRKFVDDAHTTLAYTNKGAGIYDAEGEKRFGQYMASVLPTIVNAQKSGNLPAMLDPKSKDYIGASMQTFTRTPVEIVKDRLKGEGIKTGGAFDNPLNLNGLHMAVAEGKISGEEAAWIANRLGFAKAQPAHPAAPAHPAPAAAPPHSYAADRLAPPLVDPTVP